MVCTKGQVPIAMGVREGCASENEGDGEGELLPAQAALTRSRQDQMRPSIPPASEIDTLVGSRIRARREALGISQGRLGRALGVTFSQVQKYEKGSNRIGAGRLFQVAALLGVPVQYFFEGIGDSALAPDTKSQATVAEVERLKDAFGRIGDPHARQALLSLASSMVGPPQ
jgi:transcriptional regulator with XRE-family HTH domain